MRIKVILISMLLFTAFSFIAKAQSGSNDPTFDIGSGAIGNIRTIAIQSDGKIIIGGSLSSYNGVAIINRIARLNVDGSLDVTFNPSTGASGPGNFVSTSAIQSDGKIIIGGSFGSYNGVAANNIARLDANGNLDVTFIPGSGADNWVMTSAIQSTGKIIIGGHFWFYNGIVNNFIARLNSDCSLDRTFQSGTGSSNYVETIAIQSDDKIIIGGNFTSFNGTKINRIARLISNGSVDETFNPAGAGADYPVYSSAIQKDGKIIIGGNFTTYNGVARNCIARLNSDGSLDETFNPTGVGPNKTVWTIAIQSDGKIIIGGSFGFYNGTIRNCLARLNADGTLDGTFNPSGAGANSNVKTTAFQSDGKIIIGGEFTFYNGIGRNFVARVIGGSSTSVSDIFIRKSTIYPNPVSNELKIEIEGKNEKTDYEILNSIGQVIYQGNFIEKITVQTRDFAPGVYLVKLDYGDKFEFAKIIKK